MHDLWQGLLIVNGKVPQWGQIVIAITLLTISLASLYGRLDLSMGSRLFKQLPDHEIRTNWGHITLFTIVPLLLTVLYFSLLLTGNNAAKNAGELSSRLDSVRFQQSEPAYNQWIEQRDLDGDGRISFFEDQLTATQLENYTTAGYPFLRIFQSGEVPSLTPRYRLNLGKIRMSLSRQSENSFIELFGHPKLMDDFLTKYLDKKCDPCLKSIVYTEQDYLAFMINNRKTRKMEMICLDKVMPLGVKSISRWR